METSRDETAKKAKKSWLNSRLVLVAAVMLAIIAAGGYASLFLSTTPAYAATESIVVFDFDTGSPPPSIYQNTPFDYLTSEGVTAHFSSTSDALAPAFSVQTESTIPPGYNLSLFSGQFLYDNQQTRDYLDIKFNAQLQSINLTFATIQPHGGPTEQPCYINLTAHMDSIGNQVGWTWARGVQSAQNTQGMLSLHSGDQAFNLVRIWIPYQPSAVPVTDFFIDNVVILAAPVQDTTPPVTTISLSGTVGNQGWYRSDVTVSLSATDDMSGVNKIEYSYDNAAWNTYVTPFTLATEGTTTVYYRATDNAGNVETTKSQTVRIDKTPPATTASLSGVMGNDGWYRSDVTVTLVASDSVSGVATTEYGFDNAVWTPYAAPFIVSNQGTNLVYYGSADVAGNAEPATTQTVKVDTSSPVSTISLSGAPGDVTITLAATDSASGVSTIEYSFDNSQWTVYTTPFTVTDPATTIVYYRSTDVAGNVETVKTKTLTGDNTPPVTTISLSGVLGNQGWYTSNAEVSLSATDDWSGVAKTEFSFDNVAWTTYTTPFSITTEGTAIVYYRSTDAIGNVETALSQSVKIDKSNPTGSMVINSGDVSTTSTSVTLTLMSNDAFSGVFKVRYSNDGTWDTEQWENPSTTKTWTLTTELGTKTVYFQIMDNAGLISATYQDTITLETIQPPVDTTNPVANAGPDQAATEDTIVTFDGSASTDNVAIATYTWTFMDGTSKTLTGMNPTYTFNSPGIYTVTLKVTDAAGNWATDTMVVEVLDTTNPVANAGPDRTVNIGTPVSFDAGASSDNVGIVKYEWDCGDGTNHTGKTITHTYNATGTYTVTLTVEDAAGNVAIHSIKVTVVEPPQFPFDPTTQLWIIMSVIAIGIGATATLLLKRRK